jgi:hypothetical protein
MKLVYSIEDKFYWIHNFLPITEYKLIHNKVFKNRKKLNYNSTKNTWQKQLIDNINAPNKVSVKDNDFDFYKQSLLKLPFLKHKDNNIELLIHNMGKTKSLDPCASKLYGETIKLYKGSRIMELKEKGLKLDACCLGLEACGLYFQNL